MAIPSMLTTSAQDEENWRRLERLLCELFLVLRALMLPTGDPTSPTNPTVPGGGGGQPPPPPPPGGGGGGGGSGGGGQGPFPGQFPPTTRPRRRHNAGNNNVSSNNTQNSSKHVPVQTCSSSSAQTSSKYATSLQTWHELGTELRVIADTLSSRRTHLVQLRRVSAVPCSESTEISSSPSSSSLHPGSTLTSSVQGATPRTTVTLGVSALNLLRTAWGD